MVSESTLLGASGEHLVMSELLRRGFIAGLAPVGVPNADIVVTDIEGSRMCSIQVKSRRDIGTDGGWYVKEKHESIISEKLFNCFVDFGKTLDDRPRKFLMPSAIVARVLQESHNRWLAIPGAKGQLHKDGPMRRLLPDYYKVFGSENPYPSGWLDKYQDAWSLLGLDTREVTNEAE